MPAYKGIVCTTCQGHRLHVIRTDRPAPGIVKRTRQCSACDRRTFTTERPDQPQPPKPAATKET